MALLPFKMKKQTGYAWRWGIPEKSRKEVVNSASSLPGQLKAITMEFAQSGEHGLCVWAFPAAPLPFHAGMHHGADAAFDGSAANGVPSWRRRA